jgi:hypothetical protein
LYERAIALRRETRDLRHEGSGLCGFARLLLDLGEPDRARNAWRDGSALLASVGDRRQLEEETRAMLGACAKAGIPAFEAKIRL